VKEAVTRQVGEIHSKVDPIDRVMRTENSYLWFSQKSTLLAK